MTELIRGTYPYSPDCVFLVTGVASEEAQPDRSALFPSVIVGPTMEAARHEWTRINKDLNKVSQLFCVSMTQMKSFVSALTEAENNPSQCINIKAENALFEKAKLPWFVLTSSKRNSDSGQPITQVVFANSVGDIEKWAVKQDVSLHSVMPRASLLEAWNEMEAAQCGTAKTENFATVEPKHATLLDAYRNMSPERKKRTFDVAMKAFESGLMR